MGFIEFVLDSGFVDFVGIGEVLVNGSYMFNKDVYCFGVYVVFLINCECFFVKIGFGSDFGDSFNVIFWKFVDIIYNFVFVVFDSGEEY